MDRGPCVLEMCAYCTPKLTSLYAIPSADPEKAAAAQSMRPTATMWIRLPILARRVGGGFIVLTRVPLEWLMGLGGIIVLRSVCGTEAKSSRGDDGVCSGCRRLLRQFRRITSYSNHEYLRK